jgi:hypothetical protein
MARTLRRLEERPIVGGEGRNPLCGAKQKKPAFALLALHFGEAMAAPSPTRGLVSVSGTETHLIGSKQKGSSTTNSDQL